MATKGWSFGALTSALKSGAFFDVGTDASQIAIINGGVQRVIVSGKGAALSGFQATGVEQNPAYLLSHGDIIANGLVGSVQFGWYNHTINFGIIRDTSNGSVGYGTTMDGGARHVFSLKRNAHQFFGDVYSFNDLVIGRQSSANGFDVTPTDYFRLKVNSTTEFSLQHTARSWVFNAYGGIQPQQTLGGDASNAAIRAQPNSGGWDDWRGRNSVVQVDLTGSAASSGIKFTLWGTTEVGVIQAAYSGGRGQIMLQAQQGESITLGGAGNSGIYMNVSATTAGNLVAGGIVYSGNGSSYLATNGDINGTLWNGFISSWLNSNFSARDTNISNAYNRGDAAYNLATGCVREVRWANERMAFVSTGHQPITRIDGSGENAYTSDLQCYRSDAGGWYTTTWV